MVESFLNIIKALTGVEESSLVVVKTFRNVLAR